MNAQARSPGRRWGWELLLWLVLALGIQVSLLRNSMGQEGGSVQAPLASGSRIWLEGDSTLHRWESEAGIFRMTLPVGFPDLHASLLDAVRNEASLPFVLEIESQALKSRKNALDKNLHKRIKAEEHPVIRFKAEGVRAAGQADADGYLELAASGTLFVAGVEKEIEVHARARVEEGALVVEGEKELLMTDFGIKPPVMMLGALKTRNEVRVRFVLKLEQKGGGA